MPEFPQTASAVISRIERLLEDSPELDVLGAAVATTTETTVTVTRPELYSKGTIFQVEDELFYVIRELDGFVAEVKRGYQGTTAATHSISTKIVINPRFPRANILEALNVVLGNWISFYAPQLLWDSTTAGQFRSDREVYAVPADAIAVRRVAWKPPGEVTLYDVDHAAVETFPTDIVSTGVGVLLYETGIPGYSVRVLYERPWPALAAVTDSIPSDFPPMFDSLLVEGAVLYLLGWRMVPKFRLDESVFAREQSESVPTNFNLQSVELMRQNWVANMHRFMSRRPGPRRPKKVRID